MEFYSNGRAPERSMAEAANAFSNIVRTLTESEIKPLTFNENTKLGLNDTEVIPSNIKSWMEEFRKYLAEKLDTPEQNSNPETTQESPQETPVETPTEMPGTYSTETTEETSALPKEVEKNLPKTKGRRDNKNKEQTSKYANNASRFIQDYFAAGKSLGLSKNFIQNMFIKDIVESSWGAANQSPYNFGNIKVNKSWKGAVTYGKDKNAKGEVIDAKYKSYSGIKEYLIDEVKLLKGTYKINESDSFETFTKKLLGQHPLLNKYKYATDPGYYTKMMQNINICKKNRIFNYV